MDVHLWDCVFYGAEDVAVVELRQIARKAALDADFTRAQFPGFCRLAGHVVQAVEV